MKTWLEQLGMWWRRRQTLGRRGEREAARHLRRNGYRIVARNLSRRIGEIDILAEDRRSGALAVVEVKTTTGDEPPPETHVHRDKQRKLTMLAGDLMRRYGLDDRTIRFDVIGIVWPTDAPRPTRITHHVNAFEALG